MNLSVTVYVSDMNRAVAFYEAFGFTRNGEIDARWTELRNDGGSRIGLHGPLNDRLEPVGGRMELTFDIRGEGALDRLYETCRTHGYEIGAEIRDIGFGRFFWVTDPDGLPVTIIEHT